MKETKYYITPELFEKAEIEGEPESISQWLQEMSKENFDDWCLIAGRNSDDNSAIELSQAMIVAICLLSFEIDSKELTITEDKTKELVGKLMTSILIEKGRKNGLYNIEGNLTFYGPEPKITLTAKGETMAEFLVKKKNEDVYGSSAGDTAP